MRRLGTVLALVAVAAAGAGGPVLARKAPPKKHAAAKRKHGHKAKKPAKKPAHKPAKKPVKKPAKKPTPTPAVTTPTVPTPVVPGPTTSTSTTPAPVVTTPATPAAPLSHVLGVVQSDASGGRFALSLTRTLLGSGSVTIQVRNASQDAHDLHIDTLSGTPVQSWDPIASGDPAVTKAVTLAPGTYRVYCSLPGHAALGMDTQITVAQG
ncbi:MAG: hypothetical protein JWM71_884 [Solirubrobacteraceae bacterium]|nr:hypothetical protein [Solirubrobacteraceae bacterium]